ncbi:MAG: hypothetical protein ACRCT7_12445 [Shewanella sp.]
MTQQAFELQGGRWIFTAGLGQYLLAQQSAKQCSRFIADDEDEQVDDELRSCYNCQYRRWMPTGFECLAMKANGGS